MIQDIKLTFFFFCQKLFFSPILHFRDMDIKNKHSLHFLMAVRKVS